MSLNQYSTEVSSGTKTPGTSDKSEIFDKYVGEEGIESIDEISSYEFYKEPFEEEEEGEQEISEKDLNQEVIDYFRDRRVSDLFQFLCNHLIVNEPDDPVEFLKQLLDKCLIYRAGRLEDIPAVFEKHHLEALFDSFDRLKVGSIPIAMYHKAMEILKLDYYEMAPETNDDGDVSKETFVSNAGLSGGEKRGVRPVYLRCTEGRVSWSYPEGALRVLLRHGMGREFRACLRPSPSLAASVYLEGPRSLTKIYSPNATTHVRCFQSLGGQAALYVEAATEPTIYKPTAEFAYDLQALPKGKGFDPNEECRPCTKDEMIQAFCTSELVTRGIIQRVLPIEDTDSSEIVVKVTKRLRTPADLENEVLSPEDDRDLERVGVGRHCGAAHGAGELVVMARRKLGQLVLTCAPRLDEWSALVKQPSIRDSAHCLLAS